MASIRVLPPEVVNRIAAGEVVERPASVLKELVENSIDAEATQILIEVEDGGIRLLRVRDNGRGVLPEEMSLAFQSHATSKLSDEDLERSLMGVATLGFRGEALASIAAVATVEMVSRTRGAPHAYRYRAAGASRPESLEPSAGEPGTTVEVRDLFHSVPARRKFLRTAATELSHIVQQLSRTALGFPGIHFRLTQRRKPILELPAVDDVRERLAQLLGKEAAGGLLEVQRVPPQPGLSAIGGFVGSPKFHRKDAQGQHFFVNGRWVRDRVLSHALRAAYKGYLIPGYQPVAYLYLDVPPGDVDVNVHPTKTEVRFRDSSEVHRLVERTVAEALGEGADGGGSESVQLALPPLEAAPADRTSSRDAEQGPPDLDDTRQRVDSAARQFFSSPRATAPERVPRAAASPSSRGRAADVPAHAVELDLGALPVDAPRPIQVLDSYLLLENDEGITLIDQHALHEKILFEEIHLRLQEGRVETQRLLLPEVIDLPPDLAPLVEAAAEALRPLGFELEPFGPRSAAVHGFPGLFDRGPGRASMTPLILAALEDIRSEASAGGGASPVEDRVYRLAATLACKRAAKAGMALSAAEIEHLLRRADLARDPRHCPHGRPTSVVYTRRDIERQFDRK
ncbi:MAG TPA: DNA mismatch repair endonuclease MutL [Planctomycetota bacterium]|nr:DNA mismatch repair endonuclease MutL [Planctomycetota bacterium]